MSNKSSPINPPTRILVPTDGSENGSRALEVGISFANRYNAALYVLSVIPTPRILLTGGALAPASGVQSYYEEQETEAKKIMDDAKNLAKSKGVSNVHTEIVRATNSTVEEIIESASRNKIELIVIGTRGLGGFKRLLQGSVSSGVVTHAHCNVLVIR